jgi:carbonic anhydrase
VGHSGGLDLLEQLDVVRQAVVATAKMCLRSVAVAVEAAGADTIILADGYSCRTQLADLTDRRGEHLTRFLAHRLACARESAWTLGHTRTSEVTVPVHQIR